MPKVKEQNEPKPILLSQALRQLKEERPWLPVAALRVAVSEGRVPAIRSSSKKKARYYVLLSDLLAALPTEQEPA